MPKKRKIFNSAFKNLLQKMPRTRESVWKGLPSTPREKDAECNDNQVFLDAMKGVIPLAKDKDRFIREGGNHSKPPHPAPDDVQETMTHLYGLVRGAVEMDMTFTDEYMEGCVKGFSRRLMKKLKQGEFPVQDYIDLHGLTKQEAEETVRNFLMQSHKAGLRCILIVHGRGLNSPDSFPVLKDGLPQWLGKGAVRKIIHAFATARPYDGGTGAIYVLLRKR